MALENVTRVVQMRGTKTAVEAFTATLEEGAVAYATDSDELGVYTNGAWVWIGGAAAHALVGADHTASGLTVGHVLTALSESTFGFQAPAAGAGSAWSVLVDDSGAAVVDDGGDWIMSERLR
jgi:hypothetical protein